MREEGSILGGENGAHEVSGHGGQRGEIRVLGADPDSAGLAAGQPGDMRKGLLEGRHVDVRREGEDDERVDAPLEPVVEARRVGGVEVEGEVAIHGSGGGQ